VGAKSIGATGLHETLNHFYAPFDRTAVRGGELEAVSPPAVSPRYEMTQGALPLRCRTGIGPFHGHVSHLLAFGHQFLVLCQLSMMAAVGPSNLLGLEVFQRNMSKGIGRAPQLLKIPR
jgi:hypothetical protein